MLIKMSGSGPFINLETILKMSRCYFYYFTSIWTEYLKNLMMVLSQYYTIHYAWTYVEHKHLLKGWNIKQFATVLLYRPLLVVPCLLSHEFVWQILPCWDQGSSFLSEDNIFTRSWFRIFFPPFLILVLQSLD